MYDGYLLARRHKRKKGEVLEYSANLEDNLLYDQERLENKTYHTGKPQPFFEWFPKKRLIHSLPFNDRVVNCAAYLQLWPIYCKSFYEHSYGNRLRKNLLDKDDKTPSYSPYLFEPYFRPSNRI